MNKEFKIALLPYLFSKGEFNPHKLSNIPDWPNISFNGFVDEDDEYQESDEEEPLDTENLEFLSYSDDEMVIVCGGDWQEPYTVTIGMVDNKPKVIESYASNFDDGYDYCDIEKLFDDVKGEYKKTIEELQMELEEAVEEEEYLKAASLRDQIRDYYKKD